METEHPESYFVRPKSSYPPMPVSDRAKQFMPFAALKGFEEALAEAERRACETKKPHHGSCDEALQG